MGLSSSTNKKKEEKPSYSPLKNGIKGLHLDSGTKFLHKDHPFGNYYEYAAFNPKQIVKPVNETKEIL